MPDTIQHKCKSEAVEAIEAQLRSTVIAGKWMAALWRIEDGKLVLARTTYNFPTSEFKEAVRVLDDALMEETGDIPAVPSSLPMAVGSNLGDRNEASGNGSSPVAQAGGKIVRDGNGATFPSTDDDQQQPADRDRGSKGED